MQFERDSERNSLVHLIRAYNDCTDPLNAVAASDGYWQASTTATTTTTPSAYASRDGKVCWELLERSFTKLKVKDCKRHFVSKVRKKVYSKEKVFCKEQLVSAT